MIREFKIEDISYIDSIGNLIKDDFATKENLNEILNKKYTFIYVFEEEGIIKGFIQIEEHYEITDIINIAVKEEYQRQKIASKLINYIIDNTKAEKIMLEVNENNISAINLYQKLGFIEINRRKKYYQGYDGIIMERSV